MLKYTSIFFDWSWYFSQLSSLTYFCIFLGIHPTLRLSNILIWIQLLHIKETESQNIFKHLLYLDIKLLKKKLLIKWYFYRTRFHQFLINIICNNSTILVMHVILAGIVANVMKVQYYTTTSHNFNTGICMCILQQRWWESYKA